MCVLVPKTDGRSRSIQRTEGWSYGTSEKLTIAKRTNGFFLLFTVEGSLDKSALLAATGSVPGREDGGKGSPCSNQALCWTLCWGQLSSHDSPPASVSHTEKVPPVLLRTSPQPSLLLLRIILSGPRPSQADLASSLYPCFTPFLPRTVQEPGTEMQSKSQLLKKDNFLSGFLKKKIRSKISFPSPTVLRNLWGNLRETVVFCCL